MIKNTKESTGINRNDLEVQLERDRLCHVLRYGDRTVNPTQRPLMTLAQIAKILSVSLVTVRNILLRGPCTATEGEASRYERRRKLKARHIQFLLDEDTLKHWAHRPLSERCVLFHR
jgi:hypothetical protein